MQIMWPSTHVDGTILRFCFSGWEKGKAPSTEATDVMAILVLDSPVCVMCCRNINKCNKFSRDLNCVFVSLSLSDAGEARGRSVTEVFIWVGFTCCMVAVFCGAVHRRVTFF